MKNVLLILVLFFSVSKVYAMNFAIDDYSNYPSALPNHNLEEEVANDSDRLIEGNKWISAAVDAHTYARTLGKNDFYHGIGYWVQARAEFSPTDYARLNLRSIFYSGSISYGYTVPTGDYHLFAFSGKLPSKVFGGVLEARAMDLEQVTLGKGLMIEDKETAGLMIKWTSADEYHSFKMLNDGTGGLVESDDLFNYELSLFKSLLGIGEIRWTESKAQSNLEKDRDALYYVNSEYDFSLNENLNLSYELEVGNRTDAYAGLFALVMKHDGEAFDFYLKGQGRFYQDEFADTFVGNVEHMYVSYDQYDEAYTNAKNFFGTDDNLYVYSLIFNYAWRFSENYELSGDNEYGKFDFQSKDISADDLFYFYRIGASYYPNQARKDRLTMYVSNKVLMDGYSRPPYGDSLYSDPFFFKSKYFGLEGIFTF